MPPFWRRKPIDVHVCQAHPVTLNVRIGDGDQWSKWQDCRFVLNDDFTITNLDTPKWSDIPNTTIDAFEARIPGTKRRLVGPLGISHRVISGMTFGFPQDSIEITVVPSW